MLPVLDPSSQRARKDFIDFTTILAKFRSAKPRGRRIRAAELANGSVSLTRLLTIR
jgi:hypothetical protein